eukprot:COSAG02_NODE_26_length_51927_cov_61.213881_10_plen_77_part_00
MKSLAPSATANACMSGNRYDAMPAYPFVVCRGLRLKIGAGAQLWCRCKLTNAHRPIADTRSNRSNCLGIFIVPLQK